MRCPRRAHMIYQSVFADLGCMHRRGRLQLHCQAHCDTVTKRDQSLNLMLGWAGWAWALTRYARTAASVGADIHPVHAAWVIRPLLVCVHAATVATRIRRKLSVPLSHTSPHHAHTMLTPCSHRAHTIFTSTPSYIFFPYSSFEAVRSLLACTI